MQRKDAGRLDHPAAAAAVGARLGLGPGLGPGAAAGGAGLVPPETDDLRGAGGGLEQIEGHVAADVGPGMAATAAATTAAEQVAEQALAENVAEGLEDVAARRGSAGRRRPFQARVAVAIVPGPLLRVAEDLEGLGRLLELVTASSSPGLRSGWYFRASFR